MDERIKIIGAAGRGELRNRGLLDHGGLLPLQKKPGKYAFWGRQTCLHNGLRLASESFRIRKGKGPTHARNLLRIFQVGFFLIWALHRPALSGHRKQYKKRNTPGLPPPRFFPFIQRSSKKKFAPPYYT